MISSGNQHQAQLTLIKLGRVYSCFGKWQNIVCSKACRFARLLQPGAPLVRDLFRGNCKPGPKGQRWYWEWWKGGGIHWCREFSRAHSALDVHIQTMVVHVLWWNKPEIPFISAVNIRTHSYSSLGAGYTSLRHPSISKSSWWGLQGRWDGA